MAKQATGQGFTDTRRVKELIALMAENGLTEIELVEDKSKITLKRGTLATAAAPVAYAPAAHAPAAHVPATPAPAPSAATADEKLIAIKSQMVGTFYARPNPESAPFVSVGSVVREDTVVCVIEAMKNFLEVRAEVSGKIAKILVQNGESVEFNKPMFLVSPA